MEPELFARIFHRTFGVRLTEREVGALVSYFDADGDGMVDSTEFVTMFFRMKMRRCVGQRGSTTSPDNDPGRSPDTDSRTSTDTGPPDTDPTPAVTPTPRQP